MSFFIAWRYLWSKKSTNAINIIAWISMVAIGVVTAALIVVLSVFNGFEDLVKQMYGDFYADFQILPLKGQNVYLSKEQINRINKIEGVAHLEPIVQERAILLDQEDKSIVWLKGVSADYGTYSGLPQHMIRGSFYVGDSAIPRIVMGVGVEQSLKIVAGQSPMPVTIYLPNPNAGPSADISTAMVSSNALAAGSFAVQQEFDDQYVFTHIGLLQYLMGIGSDGFTAYEIFAEKSADLVDIKDKLIEITGPQTIVKDRYQQNQSLFAAMKTEKLIIYAVAFLILIIAGFNIVSSLTMTVIDKQKDIAVLKAMGCYNTLIHRIFLNLGLMLAGIGAFSGFLLGIAICLGQQYFHWVKIEGQSFIISHYPVAVRLTDCAIVAAITTITALLAAWIPAKRGAQSTFSLR